eukprot:GHRQ01021360.1.p1 GENE.GHRQ01021360.1~~GHRQ01021360.1.p1  ORF type:complete len:136 (-),score=15.04 GHRQ01021360.1:387-794(-)
MLCCFVAFSMQSLQLMPPLLVCTARLAMAKRETKGRTCWCLSIVQPCAVLYFHAAWLLHTLLCAEPVEVIEPTVIAALNMTYPGCRLNVVVLDDGARPEAEEMGGCSSRACGLPSVLEAGSRLGGRVCICTCCWA